MTNSTLTYKPSMRMYYAKLTDADTAIESVATGSSVAIGMAAAQPPALLRALAARAERGEIDRVKLFYFHAEAPMAETVLRYELMGRFLPHSLFLQRADRELIKRGDKDGRKVVYFTLDHQPPPQLQEDNSWWLSSVILSVVAQPSDLRCSR
jgi:itaconate CoA-transferase